MSGRARLLALIGILAATAVLLALGFWQLERLRWKEALLAEIAARKAEPVATLAQLLERFRQNGDVDFLSVVVEGKFRHASEQFYYATDKGTVGWQVFTPFELPDGRFAMVNRGFVPDALRDPAKRGEGQISGLQVVLGIARTPPAAKPNRFVPDNRPGERTYFWKSLEEMAAAAGIDRARLAPFFVEAGPSDIPGGWPKGGAALVEIPNNHRQYAVTWFGLAAACLTVGAAFLYSARRAVGPGRQSA